MISEARSRISSGVKRLQLLHQQTVEKIRDFLFGGYQRLPKASLLCREPKVHESFRENIFSHDFESDHTMQPQEENREKVILGSFLNFGNIRNGRLVSDGIAEEKKVFHGENKSRDGIAEEKKEVKGEKKFVALKVKKRVGEDLPSVEARAAACLKLEKRLKEVVMEEDEEEGDPQDLLDIHEFLYYYSRLTSPFYIEMVERFFADIFG